MAEARRVADAMSDEIKQECTPIPATFLRVTVALNYAATSALGHEQTLESGSGMSALSPEADMLIVGINVCSYESGEYQFQPASCG